MDCGDGVTVNVSSSDGDCNNEDNGAPKLTIPNRPALFAYSDSSAQSAIGKSNDEKILKNGPSPGNVVNLVHPQALEILAQIHESLHSEVYASDTTESHSSTKSTIENEDFNKDNNVVVTQPTATEHPMKMDLDDNLKNGKQNFEQNQTIETPQQLPHRGSISCGIDDSTEVLLTNSAGYNDKHFGSGRPVSATDSDVDGTATGDQTPEDLNGDVTTNNQKEDIISDDILVALIKEACKPIEEISIENSSRGNSRPVSATDSDVDGTATGDQTPEDLNGEVTTNNQKEDIISDDILVALIKEACKPIEEISIENSSRGNSLSTNEQFDKEDLLKIIGEQVASIYKLKSVVEQYRRAHLTLYKQAKEMQVTIDTTTEDLDKLGFPHRAK